METSEFNQRGGPSLASSLTLSSDPIGRTFESMEMGDYSFALANRGLNGRIAEGLATQSVAGTG